jgi:hypothetical protein
MPNVLNDTLPIRFGIWHDGLGIYLPSNPGIRVTADLDDGHVILFEDNDGRGFHLDTADAEETYDYPWRTDFPTVDTTGYARCRIMNIVLTRRQDGILKAKLPLNHELPWPVTRDCQSYDRRSELMHECVVRQISAKAAGVRMSAPPRGIQQELTPAMRIKLFA